MIGVQKGDETSFIVKRVRGGQRVLQMGAKAGEGVPRRRVGKGQQHKPLGVEMGKISARHLEIKNGLVRKFAGEQLGEDLLRRVGNAAARAPLGKKLLGDQLLGKQAVVRGGQTVFRRQIEDIPHRHPTALQTGIQKAAAAVGGGQHARLLARGNGGANGEGCASARRYSGSAYPPAAEAETM